MKDLTHLEINDYLRILWNRRWYLLLVFVLTVSGVSYYAWRMPNVYKSETRIMVEEPMVSEDLVRPTLRSSPADRINSIRQQLASRTFLEKMIEQFQMYGYGDEPGFVMENAINTIDSHIGIRKTSNNTFTISFVSSDPQFAQTVTWQLAQELIRISTSSNKNKVIATDQFIDNQLRKTKDALEAQGQKITQFKILHLGELPSQSQANVTALNGLHTQLSATESAIQQAQERQKLLDFKWQERKRLNLLSDSLAAAEYAAKAGQVKKDAPSAAEAELAQKKARLAQYLAKYTPNYPDVVALTRDIERIEQQIQAEKSGRSAEVNPVVDSLAAKQNMESVDQEDPMEAQFQFEADSIKAEIARREEEKQEIEEKIKLYQGRLNLAPTLDQELESLLREENVLKSQYTNLQAQKFRTQMASTVETDSSNETYKIIDEANLPVNPEYPNRPQLLMLGIGGGLILGIGAAFGRELLDTTIGTEEEAKQLLNLPVLVTIPTVPKAKKPRKIA